MKQLGTMEKDFEDEKKRAASELLKLGVERLDLHRFGGGQIG